MDAFRPQFQPAAPSHQLCPVCLAPHFPFCLPHHAPAMRPPQHNEPFFLNQPSSHIHPGALRPQLTVPCGMSPLHAVPDTHFRGVRPPERSHPPFFPPGHPFPHIDDRREKSFHGYSSNQFPQPGDRNHLSSVSAFVDARQGFPNGWNEAEREFARQQHLRHVKLLERSESSDAQGRKQYEPLTDALGDSIHGQIATRGSFDSHMSGGFVPDGKNFHIPTAYKSQDDMQKNVHLTGPPRRDIKYDLSVQQSGKIEDDLSHGHHIWTETNDRREDVQAQNGMQHIISQKTLKRKHILSREEELLIEKGLLDDFSEPSTHGSSHHQTLQGNEQFISGNVEDNKRYYQQPEYQLPMAHAGREGWGTKFGESGDQNFRKRQFLVFEGHNNKTPEIEVERGIPKFPGNWQNESLSGRPTSWDAPSDNRRPLRMADIHEVHSSKDALYRQYQEWEAEEKHMEALKRAERLAKEIQQREESSMYLKEAAPQPERTHKPEFTQENRVHGYNQPVLMGRSDIPEATLPQYHGISMQHPSYHRSRSHPDQVSQLGVEYHQNQEYTGNPSGQDVQVQASRGTPQFCQQDELHHPEMPFQYERQPWQKDQIQNQLHIGSCQVAVHQDQQLNHAKSPHSHYPRITAPSCPQERFGEISSSSFMGVAHELPSSFPPPLPNIAPLNPPPPDSPPPPLPSTIPSSNELNLPHLSVSNLPSARPMASHGSHDHSHRSGICESQGFKEPQQSLHMGISQAQNHSHIPPQLRQSLEKSKIVDAVSIFRSPGRLTRPERFVVILRGLPGSGKSYLAKALRDVEVMNGGSAPRIHSMDDYFTCEVEKEEFIETGSSKLKKKVVKRVMEYCYEPEMEEAYRASMLKAFRKTLEEGMFKFVIVDDRNVLIADFAQFWAIAKRSGYEAYVLEASYCDVKGCAARNVHNFTEQQIQSMSERWESTPSLYLKMDVSSLFRADDLNTQDIIEVDMDADDMGHDLEGDEGEENQRSENHTLLLNAEEPVVGDRWGDKGDDNEEIPSPKGKLEKSSADSASNNKRSIDNALSGLMSTYGRKDKFVHWSDNQFVKDCSSGFSIGTKKTSLIIGPGPGYNGESNPTVVDESFSEQVEAKKSRKFVEQLRAEQEAFKAVFARRRQRIRGMDDEDDD
ncbi:hypothetical protein KP509_17G006000 [Ceratopteris richardii]|uniref:YLP motif-containing protein 1 n=1 Tax=Ceratopteris richardii TaxID=49495 RepID=A0A8T2SVK0_CERRI|nr:hypothetical protein KP509_17G006000 [Ceratopteris richardii]